MERSPDRAAREMLKVAEERGLATAWDRREQQGVPCRFGLSGVCCGICNMGPCRILEGRAPRGVCGADAETIAARNLLRMIAAGAAAHSDHGRDVVHTLLGTSQDGDYSVKDPVKLRRVAYSLGVEAAGKDVSAGGSRTSVGRVRPSGGGAPAGLARSGATRGTLAEIGDHAAGY